MQDGDRKVLKDAEACLTEAVAALSLSESERAVEYGTKGLRLLVERALEDIEHALQA